MVSVCRGAANSTLDSPFSGLHYTATATVSAARPALHDDEKADKDLITFLPLLPARKLPLMTTTLTLTPTLTPTPTA